MNEPNEKDLWDYADLQKLGYGCRTKIWKMVKAGKFPLPIDDGNGQPRWIPAEVRKYFAARPRYVMTQPAQLKKHQQENFNEPKRTSPRSGRHSQGL